MGVAFAHHHFKQRIIMSDEHSEPSQKKKWIKRTLLILLILLLVIALALASSYGVPAIPGIARPRNLISITKVDEDQAKIKEKLGEAKPPNVSELQAPKVTNQNGSSSGEGAESALAANASEHDKNGDGIR